MIAEKKTWSAHERNLPPLYWKTMTWGWKPFIWGQLYFVEVQMCFISGSEGILLNILEGQRVPCWIWITEWYTLGMMHMIHSLQYYIYIQLAGLKWVWYWLRVNTCFKCFTLNVQYFSLHIKVMKKTVDGWGLCNINYELANDGETVIKVFCALCQEYYDTRH